MAQKNNVIRSFFQFKEFSIFCLKLRFIYLQVDCCFLRQNLWRHLSDEQIALSLIDEIVSSAVHRSVDPKLMEPVAVKALCSR